MREHPWHDPWKLEHNTDELHFQMKIKITHFSFYMRIMRNTRKSPSTFAIAIWSENEKKLERAKERNACRQSPTERSPHKFCSLFSFIMFLWLWRIQCFYKREALILMRIFSAFAILFACVASTDYISVPRRYTLDNICNFMVISVLQIILQLKAER